MKDNTKKPEPGGVISKTKIYRLIADHAEDIIKGLVDLTTHPNESVRLGALKVLANKIVPDLKAIEMKDENGNPMPFVLNEYIITKDEFRRLLETRKISGDTDASVVSTPARLE